MDKFVLIKINEYRNTILNNNNRDICPGSIIKKNNLKRKLLGFWKNHKKLDMIILQDEFTIKGDFFLMNYCPETDNIINIDKNNEYKIWNINKRVKEGNLYINISHNEQVFSEFKNKAYLFYDFLNNIEKNQRQKDIRYKFNNYLRKSLEYYNVQKIPDDLEKKFIENKNLEFYEIANIIREGL